MRLAESDDRYPRVVAILNGRGRYHPSSHALDASRNPTKPGTFLRPLMRFNLRTLSLAPLADLRSQERIQLIGRRARSGQGTPQIACRRSRLLHAVLPQTLHRL